MNPFYIGATVGYIMETAPLRIEQAIIEGIGKRRDSGRTYYVIAPVIDGRRRRARCVSWSSVTTADRCTASRETAP